MAKKIYRGWLDFDGGGSVVIYSHQENVVQEEMESILAKRGWCDDREGPVEANDCPYGPLPPVGFINKTEYFIP